MNRILDFTFCCDKTIKTYNTIITYNTFRDRIHPESGQHSYRHTCPQCNKQFAHKTQLAKHLQNCDGKFGDDALKIKDNKVREGLKLFINYVSVNKSFFVTEICIDRC